MRPLALVLAGIVAAATTLAGCSGVSGGRDDVITVYVGRSQALVEPLLNQFAEESGIDIRVRYGDGTDLVLAILEEGANTDVDAFYGQDVGALGALREADLLAPLKQGILDKVDPAFRSPEGLWVGVSGRARVIVYNTDTVDPAALPASILDYTDPRWNGKIGIVPRSDGFPEFVTALRVVHGDDFALQWLEDLKANNPRTYPNNLAALQAVANRELEIAFLNHYYLYRFLAERGEGFKARNAFFTNGDLGGLFLVSGAAVLKSSDNSEAAQTFVDFLLSDEAQQYFADHDYEYPLAGDATPDEALPAIETLKAPDIDLSDLGDLRGSLDLMREAGILP
jgi:iron(III) transport system substrate-binding protein